MRKVAALLSIGLVVGLAPSAFAATKPAPGVKCTKVSTFQQTPKGLLVCDQVKKKKVWRKTTRVEAKFHKREQVRIQKELQKKSDEAVKAEADRIALEAQAAADAAARAAEDKAAADAEARAAADAADKAAADKAAADKAAADKAAADKAAADKAAANAAAAAEIPTLIVGSFYSGRDEDDKEWKWVAVRVTNSASTKIYSHSGFNVLIGDSSGGIVDSTFEPSFPLLGPRQTIWYVTTQFNSSPSSQIVFQKQYSTRPSPLAVSELPTTSNARLIPSPYLPNRKSVAVTVRNNSSQVLSKSSSAYAVLLDSNGVPIYAARGFFDKAILPGGTTEIIIGDDFTFNGQVSSIQVTIAPLL